AICHRHADRSPLFPYTTLFRSASVNSSSSRRIKGPIAHEALLSLALLKSNADRPSKSRKLTSLPSVAPTIRPSEVIANTTSGSRSEEHTSELQSRENLVCRLLL